MENEGQQLLVTLAARFDKYERDLERQKQRSKTNFRQIQKDAETSAKGMEKSMGSAADNIAGKLQGMFAPLMAGGAVAAAAGAFRQIASSIAEVGREADKARVTTRTWQQWTYVAAGAGASIDGMTDALKELNIRGDEFATTGKGSAQEAFERLGMTAADVAERLRDPSAFLDEIIAKVQKLDRAAQTRIMDELFGGTGAEELSKVLGLSVEQIQKLRSEAALFTEEQLEAAKKIDAEFETLWRNVMVYSKQAAVESVGYARQIIGVLSTLKGDGIISDSRNYVLSDEGKLNTYLERRAAILERISDLRSKPDFDIAIDGLALQRLEDDLKAVDRQIEAVTPHTKEFAAALRELSSITLGTSGAFNNTASAAANFKSALTDLKNMVPELKAELDELAKLDGIDAAFERAVKNARTPQEIEEANRLRDRARTSALYGSHKDILSLIGAAEGTDKGRGYNETLGYGKFTGGNRNLTGMTLNEVMALQKQMLAHPDNHYNSSALGRYQITRQTLQDFMPRLGLAGDHLFDEKTQDALAQAILGTTGGSVEKLRGRWEGLRRVDAGTISAAYGGTQTVPDKLAPSESQQKAADDAKRAADARQELNNALRDSNSLAQIERATVGMSARQRAIELEVFQRVQAAKRSGLSLSDQEIQKIREQVTATAGLRAETDRLETDMAAANQAKMFFAQSFTQSLSGLITGTTSLTNAVRNLANSLIDAVLQATLLGQGPLAGLFGFGGGSGILGAIFGFAEGGYTGRGSKHEPAGVVHKGEYVMSAAATRRIGVANLERMHQGAKRGYAEGGYVSETPTLSTVPQLGTSNTPPAQAIQINAPITVNGSAGTPEQNTDLANKMAKSMEQSMKGMVADEIRKQTRPGNYMNQRTR